MRMREEIRAIDKTWTSNKREDIFAKYFTLHENGHKFFEVGLYNEKKKSFLSNFFFPFKDAWKVIKESNPRKEPTEDELKKVAYEFTKLYSHLSGNIHVPPDINPGVGIALDPSLLGAKYVALMKLVCTKGFILFHEVEQPTPPL